MDMDEFLTILLDGLGFGEKKTDSVDLDDLDSELSANRIDSVHSFASD